MPREADGTAGGNEIVNLGRLQFLQLLNRSLKPLALLCAGRESHKISDNSVVSVAGHARDMETLFMGFEQLSQMRFAPGGDLLASGNSPP